MAWAPPGSEHLQFVRAVELYQALLRFHRPDAAPQLAFADADLERLAWGWNAAFGEDKNTRYKTALETFIRNYGDFEIAALAYERQGRVLQQEGGLVAAHNLAQRGAELFPQSPGGKLCRNLVNDLKAKSAAISTERVWNGLNSGPAAARPAGPVISIRYRNVEAVYFRAIPYDWNVFLEKRHHRPEQLSEPEWREILAKAPVLEWSEKLPPTKDFKEKTFFSSAPNKLKPGFYFIAASHKSNFSGADNLVTMTDVWVSELALVTRERYGQIEGFLLEAGSGEPVAGAAVSVWHLDNQGNRVSDPRLTTDENGFFALTEPAQGSYLFLARDAQGRALATAGDVPVFPWQRPQPERPAPQTVFFTDRAIYRPGQIIQYKGICLWVDQAGDNYQVLKGEAGDGGVQRHQRQGDRAAETSGQRLRLFRGEFHRPQSAARPDVPPDRRPRPRRDCRSGRGVQTPEIRGDARRAQDRRQAQPEGESDGTRDRV